MAIEREKIDSCIAEIARWFVRNRRHMKTRDIRAIATKYFTSDEDLTELYEYLASPQGVEEVAKLLRLEGWKAGLVELEQGGGHVGG